ncbi:hypothetical protein D9611_013297 [Ephemerocybe angulata]|uniref:Uncharacterized protein n=1 Tax=Ephemerocybe angulata TaxID=980116 RepID=A0A8H5CC24_9AGAR|nr:hypothetical protein D9611_013297 [Tulosesus angulatus]
MEQEPPVHLLGSPGFFPALINHIKSLSNFPSLPLDQVTVQTAIDTQESGIAVLSDEFIFTNSILLIFKSRIANRFIPSPIASSADATLLREATPCPQPNRHQSSSGTPPFAREPISQLFIDTLRRHCRATHFTPELGMYLSDLFAAARHHPRLDGMLLTAKARKDAEDLARAARVIGSDLTGMELIRPVDKDDNESEYFDAQSDTRYLRTIDESSTTNLLRKDSFSKISSMGLDDDAMDVEEVLVSDVTEVDVARTMPRVVTHRLRLRDGPEDEVLASAVIGATFGGSFATKTAPPSFERTETGVQQSLQKGYEGLTVKDVLVDILNKV